MDNKKAFSFTKGYTFRFEDNGHVIEHWNSAFSGSEKVYVNGELVASQRNLSKDSNTSFSIGANTYVLNLKVTSIQKGPFVCTLSKNGLPYQQQRLIFSKDSAETSASSITGKLLFFVVLGAMFGLVRVYWQLPMVFSILFFALLFMIVFIYQLKHGKCMTPMLENVEVLENEQPV